MAVGGPATRSQSQSSSDVGAGSTAAVCRLTWPVELSMMDEEADHPRDRSTDVPRTTPTSWLLALLGSLLLSVVPAALQTPSLAAVTTAGLDTAYGEGGFGVLLSVQGEATTLVDLDDAGRVVTASQYAGGSILSRLTATGRRDSLDVSWGDAQVRALDARAGRITVVRSGIHAFVDRVLDDGSPDVAFDEDGRLELPLGTTLTAGAVDASGRTVLGGSFRREAPSGSGDEVTSWLARLDAQGRFDPSFNAGGAQPGVVSSAGWAVTDLALDGDLVVTVERSQDGSATRLARWAADGSPDAGFGVGGTAATGPYLEAVAVDAAHRVLTTVHDPSQQYAVRRWTAAGTVDTSFGQQGTSAGTFPGSSCQGGQADITVLADGGLVLTPRGHCVSAVQVLRLTGSGLPDTAFAPSGALEVRAVGPYAMTAATSVLQHADGDLGVGVRSSALGAIRIQAAPKPVLTPVLTPVPRPVMRPGFTPSAPARVLDASVGTTLRTVQIAGVHGVPADATAVVVNSEVSRASTTSFLRVVPFGQEGRAATMHLTPGRTVSNLAVVALRNGKLQVKVGAGTARVVLDLAGYYAAGRGAGFTPSAPARVLDASVGTTLRTVQIAGVHGVPADATAVVVNSEVSRASTTSFLRVVPFGQEGRAATMHLTPGRTVSNLAVVALRNGKLQVKVGAGTARVVLDLAGYYAAGRGAGFTPSAPARVLDASVGTTLRTVQIAGVHGVPADATAVVVNSEVSRASTTSFLRVVPFGQEGRAATMHLTPGRTVSNLAVVALRNGKLQVKVGAGTGRVVLDLAGYTTR